MTLSVLLAIPHVFAPKEGSLYSSQTEAKRSTKQAALEQVTMGNLCRHGSRHFIHASLGKGMPVVTRQLHCSLGVDLTIQLYSPADRTLADAIAGSPTGSQNLQTIEPIVESPLQVPLFASRCLLEQAIDYDIVGYLEDDLLIEDPEFFAKIAYFVAQSGGDYVFLPHRCEHIPRQGDVILSGDPDGGRPDLFWDTGERIEICWPLGSRTFYRATNPHSGCYFLTREQALRALNYWQCRQWQSEFELSGPLEQAASGLLLPMFKLMKPIPDHYRFFMVRHQDELWKRHHFEEFIASGANRDTKIIRF